MPQVLVGGSRRCQGSYVTCFGREPNYHIGPRERAIENRRLTHFGPILNVHVHFLDTIVQAMAWAFSWLQFGRFEAEVYQLIGMFDG